MRLPIHLPLLLIAWSVVTAATWLTKVSDRYPSLSPDGEWLLFESNRTGQSALYISKADGSELRILVEGPEGPSSGSWSPDGQRIVYNGRGANDEFDIFTVNADGSGKRNLTNSLTEEAHPHWSPDGKRIYFNSDRAAPDRKVQWTLRHHDLFSMAADGSDIRRITDCRAVCTNPNPSPDGEKITFRIILNQPGLGWSRREVPQNSDIAILDLKSGKIDNLTQHAAYDTWPSWSPDSRWVAFGSNRDGVAFSGQIYLVPVAGGEARKVTQGPLSYGEPSFAPSGKTLLFSASAEPGISLISALDVAAE